MMKNFIFTMILLCASTASASVVSVICEPIDLVTMNRFSAVGMLDMDEEGNTETTLYIVTEVAGIDGIESESLEIEVEGSTKLIENMTKTPFLFSQLLTQSDADTDKFVVKLLVDYPQSSDSRLTNMTTGKEYRSNCRSL